MPYQPAQEPVIGEILHIPTGSFVTEAQMLAAAADASIVYVGETHDNLASHRQELTVLKALADRYPEQVALGMEMLTPEQQSALNRWVAGELSEKELLKQTRWYDVWRMDFDYYKELFLFCRDRNIPIIGLNATRTQVRAVASGDLSTLDEQQRKQLPQMDMTDPYQRETVKAVYGGHSHGGGDKERFLRVQTLWDEMMAANVVRYLTSPQGTGKHMLVIAGGHHVRHGFGIPRRVFRKLPVSYVLIGSEEIDIPDEKKEKIMDVTLPDLPMPAFDYMLYTRYEMLDKQQVRLGVMLEESADGVVIKAVMPSSAAARAGLQKGDIFRVVDGNPVQQSFDVIYEIKQKKTGDKVVLMVERDGMSKELVVPFDKED